MGAPQTQVLSQISERTPALFRVSPLGSYHCRECRSLRSEVGRLELTMAGSSPGGPVGVRIKT